MKRCILVIGLSLAQTLIWSSCSKKPSSLQFNRHSDGIIFSEFSPVLKSDLFLKPIGPIRSETIAPFVFGAIQNELIREFLANWDNQPKCQIGVFPSTLAGYDEEDSPRINYLDFIIVRKLTEKEKEANFDSVNGGFTLEEEYQVRIDSGSLMTAPRSVIENTRFLTRKCRLLSWPQSFSLEKLTVLDDCDFNKFILNAVDTNTDVILGIGVSTVVASELSQWPGVSGNVIVTEKLAIPIHQVCSKSGKGEISL